MKSDKKTFTAIVEEFSQPLYWHIRRMVTSHDDASDILQDSLVKAYRKLWQLRDPKMLRPWLYRIATNECISFLKNKERFAPMDESLLDKEIYFDNSNNAEVLLQKAIMTLSPQQRSVFCLRYYNELDYKEIALVTGSSEGSLKVSYHNAKEKITKYLEDKQI